jgi:uncharacterized membrane protein
MNSSSASFVLFTAGALLAGAGQAGAADAPYIFTDLDLPGSTGQAFARAISNGGLMAGYGPHINDPFVYHAWLWGGGGPSQFFGPHGSYSHAFGINSAGKIVGDLELPDHTQRAMVWNDTGTAPKLETPAGYQSEANAINDSGQVAGAIFSTTPLGTLRSGMARHRPR